MGEFLRSYSDFYLTMRAAKLLAGDPLLTRGAIRIEVHAGRAFLHGAVRRCIEKWAAEADIRRLSGICGVENLITVSP
jgi:osmotically-inducible protein OsmY